MTEPGPDEHRDIRRFTITAKEEQPDSTSQRVRSEYVEEAWLPYIGPTALLLARRMDLALSNAGKSAVVVAQIAEGLGVYPEEIIAACHRLARYGLAEWSERDPTLYLSRYWPKVPAAIQTKMHRQALLSLPDVGREVTSEPSPALVS